MLARQIPRERSGKVGSERDRDSETEWLSESLND